jgi:ribosomal protein L35AE/L33A
MSKLSAAGQKTYIESVGALDASGQAIVTLGNFFLDTRQGLQLNQTIVPTAADNIDMVKYTTAAGAANEGYLIYFTNCQQPKSVDPSGNRQYSYSIDQIQLVLVQETMTMPMTPAYSSFSVEVAAIESDQQQYSRQFILTAANTYNGLFMIPDYLTSAGGSLVATARGLANYRISVNNIANTNRVVTIQDVTSQSPASLHFDKLMTTFQNSEYNLRNFTGIKTTTDSHSPVTVLPIKLYSGVVNGTYQYAPQTMGATVQVDLYGSPKTQDDTIYKGPIFFFKQAIRNIATGMGQVV